MIPLCIEFLHRVLDMSSFILLFFFFFNDTATTEIYTLSLHDALPIHRRYHADRGSGPDHRSLRGVRSEEHTSELQSHSDLVCRLLLEKKKKKLISIVGIKETETKQKTEKIKTQV